MNLVELAKINKTRKKYENKNSRKRMVSADELATSRKKNKDEGLYPRRVRVLV